MARSYQELMQFILPKYHEDPPRMEAFYGKIYLYLSAIPAGGVFRISDNCKLENIPMFTALAEIIIIDETERMDIDDACLELVDYNTIRRRVAFIPSKPYELRAWGCKTAE